MILSFYFPCYYMLTNYFFPNSVVPLLKESVGILMQRIPTGLEKNLHIGYQRVSVLLCTINAYIK